MVELKISDIVKILPFDEKFKVYMIEMLESIDIERKVSVERVLWDLYDIIFTLKYEENLQIAKTQLATSGQPQELTEAFYTTIREQTQQELLSNQSLQGSYVDIELTRHKLQQVMSEKQIN